MSTPEEEALVGPIVDIVTSFLDAVLKDDETSVAQRLTSESLKRIGLSVFGLDAISIPMGLAAKPHQLGLTSVEVGDGVALVEIRGRSAAGDDASVCTVILASEMGDWRVEDIWPVPADCDFTVDSVLEPTVMFYNGQAQLSISQSAELDFVERVLIPALQADGLGLHMIEQGVKIWRAFSEGHPVEGEAQAWAAGVHLAVLALVDADPDPGDLALRYAVPEEVVAACFMQIANRLGFDRLDEEEAPVERPSGLIDLAGRPIPPSGGADRGRGGGIILPHG
jgi:hypothetical protein